METLDLSTLRDDDDTLVLDDGRVLRLRIRPDDTNPFDEYDVYGRIGWDERDSETGNRRRPRDFDGNAERMWLQQNSGPVWWQPPADIKRNAPGFAELRRIVNDLASFGMYGYVLELLDGKDAYQHGIVVNVASLWGIEPFVDAAYAEEIIADLVRELLD